MDQPNVPSEWPQSDASRFVQLGAVRWHIQETGSGPDVLFLHGAGGSTHSMAPLCDALASQYRCISFDLPGQGFSAIAPGTPLGLPDMASQIGDLLTHAKWQPEAIVAHSAGAAIALKLALTETALKDTKIVSINGALGNFRGLAGVLFPLFAKILSANPMTARLFSQLGQSEDRVRRIIEGTGSTIPAESLRCYHTLMSDRAHVENTLGMMASWSLDHLLLELPKIEQRVLFLVGGRDKAVPPDTAPSVARRMQKAQVHTEPDLGHLAHEEAPELIAQQIRNFLRPDVPNH